MSTEREIAFGNGQTCRVELESAATQPGSDPDFTVSTYLVTGLSQGDLSILVTRTHVPSLVKVEVVEHGTSLGRAELEQIRSGAEAIFRAQTQ